MGTFLQKVGSSPLARGLLKPLHSGTAVLGIIPARAGFTTKGGQSWSESWDHPRSRGVYATATLSCW